MDFNECQSEEMILVLDAIQGIGRRIGQCTYRHGDCIERTTSETDAKLRESCIGMSGCKVPVNVAWMESCNAYSSYNYVLYHCVPSKFIKITYNSMNYHGLEDVSVWFYSHKLKNILNQFIISAWN